MRRAWCSSPATRSAAATRPDWRALAQAAHQARLTLVIYMGVSGAERIQEQLLTGLPAGTPVAIVQHASACRTQRHAVTTLGDAGGHHRAKALASPSVIVVGDVLRGIAAVAADSAPPCARPDGALPPNPRPCP
jgi:uroporphyrin-III C-methyltransferase